MSNASLSYVPYQPKQRRHERTASYASDVSASSNTSNEPASTVGSPMSGTLASPPTPRISSPPLSKGKMPDLKPGPAPRNNSTFRRFGPRVPGPSPLRPQPALSRNPATSLAVPASKPPGNFRTSSTLSAPPAFPREEESNSPPSSVLGVTTNPSSPGLTSLSLSPSPSIPSLPLPIPAATPSLFVASPSPVPISASFPADSPSPSRLQPVAPALLAESPPDPSTYAKMTAPYRAGFQPKGVYTHRTDEFMALRESHMSSVKGEERRIQRRLEKLVELYFPPDSSQNAPSSRPQPARRSSSLFSLPDLKGKHPADFFRNVMDSNNRSNNPNAIRAAEQIITPWQDDASASVCPICTTSFHPLTNRKHHCRLCGRVVCALPPKKPNRPAPCSHLINVDRSTGLIDIVPETISYGVAPAAWRQNGDPNTRVTDGSPRGLRVCRECHAIVMRKQFANESRVSTTFTRLHDAFVALESDIESSLNGIELLLPSLASTQPSSEALSRHKALSSQFTQYDTLAKRIKALPAHHLPTGMSDQERVQNAVWSRAVGFMQAHVGLLQKLPKPQQKSSSTSSLSALASVQTADDFVTIDGEAHDPEKIIIEADSALAMRLQPLLEQEALLESFIYEANEQRKFEDVKSLKMNLDEIQAEIARLVASGRTRIIK